MPASPNVRDRDSTSGDLGHDARAEQHSSGSHVAQETTPELPPGETKPDVPQISVRILWCPAMLVRDRFGGTVLARLTEQAGFDTQAVQSGKLWISARQVAAFLQSVR